MTILTAVNATDFYCQKLLLLQHIITLILHSFAAICIEASGSFFSEAYYGTMPVTATVKGRMANYKEDVLTWISKLQQLCSHCPLNSAC